MLESQLRQRDATISQLLEALKKASQSAANAFPGPITQPRTNIGNVCVVGHIRIFGLKDFVYSDLAEQALSKLTKDGGEPAHAYDASVFRCADHSVAVCADNVNLWMHRDNIRCVIGLVCLCATVLLGIACVYLCTYLT